MQRRDRRERQAPGLALGQKLPHGPSVRRPRAPVGDPRGEELQEPRHRHGPRVDDQPRQHEPLGRRRARRGSAPRSARARPTRRRAGRTGAPRAPDPGEPRLLAAERGPLPVLPQLPQERGPPKDTRRPDELRPERPHQLRRRARETPEQPLHVAPREQVPGPGSRAAGWRRGRRGATGAGPASGRPRLTEPM